MLKLEIPTNIFERMVAQAKALAPIEACGILAGKDNKAEKLFEMTNADNRSDQFMMEPKEQFTVVKNIRSAGLEMLAIYHSHPETPARPSPEDIRLAFTPDVIYLIVSLRDTKVPDVKGFVKENGMLTEVPIKVLHR